MGLDSRVIEVLLNANFLPETRMYLASAMINKPLKDFRCYTLKQLTPELFPNRKEYFGKKSPAS
jgi:hypothetical protein